jgi:hypothetical protein
MAERKPLTAGLAVVPPGTDQEEVRAFVSQQPTEKQQQTTTSEIIDSQSADEGEYVNDNHDAKRRMPKTAIPVGLIPVTVRLRPEIAAALKRASLERQLSGTTPNTQQEIVEQALKPWLKREGVLA